VGFLQELDEHDDVMAGVRALAPDVERIAGRMIESVRAGGTVLWFGNGGSAAQAQHLACELVVRYEQERPGISSVALTTDTSILTAEPNDHSFDELFARQVEALARPGDVAVALSTSGTSPNVLRGVEAAAARGTYTVGLVGGDGGKLASLVDDALVVASSRASRVQEAHLFLGHLLCAHVEAAIAKDAG
jgi:D-sedoheptulose 7-phosphate isomerase